MIERYIELKMITEFYIPFAISMTIAVIVSLALVIRCIIKMCYKRQQKMIDRYFSMENEDEVDHEK